MSKPTSQAIIGKFVSRGDDFLQLLNAAGSVEGWIDSNAMLQGSLAQGGGGGGGGGIPGGSPTEIQFNNTTFGGIPGSSVDPPTGSITLQSADSATALTVIGPSTNDLPAIVVVPFVQDGSNFNVFAAPDLILFSLNSVSGGTVGLGVMGDSSSLRLGDEEGSGVAITAGSGVTNLTLTDADAASIVLSPSVIGFFSATAVGQQTVTGVKLSSDTVMASLLAALVAYGLIIDSTT